LINGRPFFIKTCEGLNQRQQKQISAEGKGAGGGEGEESQKSKAKKVKSLRTQVSCQLSTHLQSLKFSIPKAFGTNPQTLKSSNSQILKSFKSSNPLSKLKTRNTKPETRNSPVKSVNYATYLWHSVRIPTQKLIIFV